MVHEEAKKGVQRGHRSVAVLGDCRMRIKLARTRKRFNAAFCSATSGENPASRFGSRRISSAFFAPLSCTSAAVFSIRSVASRFENLLQRLIEFQFAAALRIAAIDFSVGRVEHRHFRAQQIEIEKPRLEPVVQIRGVVSNFVHQIDQLRFQRGPLVQQIFSELGKFAGRIIRANV